MNLSFPLRNSKPLAIVKYQAHTVILSYHLRAECPWCKVRKEQSPTQRNRRTVSINGYDSRPLSIPSLKSEQTAHISDCNLSSRQSHSVSRATVRADVGAVCRSVTAKSESSAYVPGYWSHEPRKRIPSAPTSLLFASQVRFHENRWALAICIKSSFLAGNDWFFLLPHRAHFHHLISFHHINTQHPTPRVETKDKHLGSPRSRPYKMTKTGHVKEGPKKPSHIEKMAERFPSPPKKDGTADPENILAKKRREEAEAKQGRDKGGSSSGGGKKG